MSQSAVSLRQTKSGAGLILKFGIQLVLLILVKSTLIAQSPDVNNAKQTAKTYIRQGDYTNAIVVLNHSLQQDPNNLETLKDLAFTYYLQGNYSKSVETAKPLLDRKDVDVQCYQLLGMNYKAFEERKECEKMYKRGIKRFPQSGELYNEYGEMLWAKQDKDALKLWEEGIKEDPNYSSNYYNLSKAYYGGSDKVWCLLYGEIFINLESYSKRTPEIKNMLGEGYKKLFSDAALLKNQNIKNQFVLDFLSAINDQSSAIAQGINAESLSVLRSLFLTQWFDKNSARWPFRLFDYQQQLLKEGLFDAYNHWIFDPAQNLPASEDWVKAHPDEYNRFISFQKGRIFKWPPGQYYHSMAAK